MTNAACHFKRRFVMAIVMCLAAASLAHAQTKAAQTRDIDNADLAPVRIWVPLSLQASETFKEADSVTVPAGKRLVLDNASVWALTSNASDVITAIWLQVKNVQHFTLLDPANNEVRKICGGSCGLAAYNRTIKMTFEAGETVHATIFAEGTNDAKTINIYLQGHYVTP